MTKPITLRDLEFTDDERQQTGRRVIADPSTGEILDDTGLALDAWGEVAMTAMLAVTTNDYRLKRFTLVALADAAFNNESIMAVYDNDKTGTRASHHRWLNDDPAYHAAHTLIVGTVSDPGIARLQRSQVIDEREDMAITALSQARATLRVASASAVATLIDGLSASNKYGPKWHERIMAANSILDRADPETAVQSAPAQALIDKAIMHVYGATLSPAVLPAGEPVDTDTVVLEGEYSADEKGTTPATPIITVEPLPAAERDEHTEAISQLADVLAHAS